MHKTIYIALLLISFTSVAQVLLPTSETAFDMQHNFNPAIIKTRGIKKITFEIIDKKDFEVAVDQNLTETYEFTPEGKVSRFYYTTVVKTNERQVSKVNHKGQKITYTVSESVFDTVSTTYFYSDNNLILKRYHDGLNYYESRYYRYDSLGNLTRELRFKETNNSSDRSVFILGNQVLLSEDSFQYQKFSSGQLKCTYLNNEYRSYKERITNYDSLGRKKNESEHYTAAAWIMQQSKYEYNDKHLVLAQFEGNANNKIVVKNTYEYDDMDELYAEKHYKNDVLVKEISYITSKADSLLNSFIIRDPANKSLRIVKLKYDFGLLSKNAD